MSYWVPNFLDSVYKNSASVNLYLATLHHWLFLILLSMAVWGIYYELLGFAQHQFVADAIPLKLHSGAWGVLGVARSTAYFVSPLIGGGLLYRSLVAPLWVALGLSISEMVKWKVLLTRVWPLIVMSVFLSVLFLSQNVFWQLGVGLYLTIPKKIKMPQAKIEAWKKEVVVAK